MLLVEPILRKYFRGFLPGSVKDGISYIEFRNDFVLQLVNSILGI